MHAWENGELLAPLSADAPCGRSLEDTQTLASFDTFRLFGQATPFEPAPDWSGIRDNALKALRESKDLRLLAHLGSAVLRTDGLLAFADTLSAASHWLTAYWTQIYPLVDEDAILRRSALNCFADQMAVIDGVRRTTLVRTRQHGSFSLRDLDMASGQVQPLEGEQRPDEREIAAAFAAVPIEELQLLQQSAARSLQALQQIDAAMREAGGASAAPSFDPLTAQLTRIDRLLREQTALRVGAGADPAADAAPADLGVAAASAAALGPIRSRDDAVRALDAVSRFFRETEPSSPVPLFLERAKRLVSKNFLEVLADVAPDALAHVRAAGGLRPDE